MDIVIANKDFERMALIDNASVIWASRYYKSGDFEIQISATQENIDLIKYGKYVIRDDDEDNIGVIEDYVINGTVENGDTITVSGKFACGYYLGSRIVSQQTILYGNTELQIRNLIKDNLTDPVNEKRKTSFIKLGDRNEQITSKISLQTTGSNLQEKVEEICEEKGIGMRMPLIDGNLYFELYQGVDRSFNQTENPYVVFSDEYDNLQEANFQHKTSEYKNVAFVAGEGEGVNRKIVETYSQETEPSGEDRFEIWVDQRNISSNEGELTDEEVESQMKEQGAEDLVSITEAFEGTVSLSGYKYGKPEDGGDVFLGDIVTVQKKKWNGIYVNARIVEVIESEDQNGKTTVLTFGI